MKSKIVAYQSAFFQSSTGLNAFVTEMKCAAGAELLNVDSANPLGLLSSSVIFGDFENTLLNARAGSADPEAFADANNFYMNNDALFEDVIQSFVAYQTDLLNVDPQNSLYLNQVKEDGKEYAQTIGKIENKAHQYKKLELQNAVNAAALTAEEQQLWNQFHSALTEKCKAACSNYIAAPIFVRCPWVELDLEKLDPTNPAAVLEVKLEEQIAINANISPFKLLEQGCFYEFLNVLLSKRNDTDSALSSFNQLQDKLNQFLNNVDVNNPIALLEAQVDMLAYEKGVAAAPVISAPTLVVK